MYLYIMCVSLKHHSLYGINLTKYLRRYFWPVYIKTLTPPVPHIHKASFNKRLQVLKYTMLTLSFSVKSYLKIIAPYKHSGWKRLLRSSSSTVNPTPPCLLNHAPKCHVYTFFEHFQGWWLHHFAEQPVPMLDHSFSKEFFLNRRQGP